MNRINPIQIIALIVVLFLFFSFKLSDAKEELVEEKDSYKKTSQIAIKLDALKSTYKDKTKTLKKLNKILNYPLVKKAEVTKDVKSSKVVLEAESINKQSLNYLMGKLLNNTFNISSLNIKKLDEKTASIKVEIKW